jgi:hypothetical protein
MLDQGMAIRVDLSAAHVDEAALSISHARDAILITSAAPAAAHA